MEITEGLTGSASRRPKQQKQKKNIAVVLFSILLLALGGAYLAARWQPALDNFDSSKWAETRGVVVSSNVVHYLRFKYKPDIAYNYTVDGKDYASRSGQELASGNAEKSHSQQIVGIYQPGTMINVHYLKDNPAKSLLTTENYVGIIGDIGAPLVVFLAGLGGIVWYFKPR